MIRNSVADEHPVARQHHLVNRVVADEALLLHPSRTFSGLKDVPHLNLKCRLPSRSMAFERMTGAASRVDHSVLQLEAEARLVGEKLEARDLIRPVRTCHALPGTK